MIFGKREGLVSSTGTISHIARSGAYIERSLADTSVTTIADTWPLPENVNFGGTLPSISISVSRSKKSWQ